MKALVSGHAAFRTLVFVACVACIGTIGGAQSIDGDWRAYGHDVFGSRYSPLTAINRDNVSRLKVAWTYHTGEPLATKERKRSLEVTPLMVNNTLYISTPLGKIVALEEKTEASPRHSGGLEKHYSPRTPARLVPTHALDKEIAKLGDRVAVLAFSRPDERVDYWLRMPREPQGYAQKLYAALRELDGAGCELIVIESPPEAGASCDAPDLHCSYPSCDECECDSVSCSWHRVPVRRRTSSRTESVACRCASC